MDFTSDLILLLGGVGLAAIGVIPIRGFTILRTSWEALKLQNVIPRIYFGFLAVCCALALVLDVYIASIIYSCLTSAYCGPNIASGWLYLAVLGSAYLFFELVVFVSRLTYARGPFF